ncbi:hypothetical protein GCM10023084_53850 [Streptomyces lacrimifluminis]|uniref:Uncharacterized protein n=1 Tax=Streptomyces lacrimifluminis TaxID=1500077 RepID=A0A917NW42_9ACTN|nr:hypothetical protein [Streptomyces lacrimifluminis]GGJ34445.1 hypothetical protein GCM10012282_34010 [Streptomyces lacrimifluminis]
MNNKQPVPVPRRESEASQFLQPKPDQESRPIVVFEVPPKKKDHISLGDFTDDEPPIGFSIEIAPDLNPKDVDAQITKLSAEYDEYELVLHVANHSGKTVNVEVQQL